MAIVDLTTWTEEDPDAELTLTSTGDATLTTPNQDGDARVYTDKGVDGIGDFTHQFQITTDNIENSEVIFVWAIQNGTDALYDYIVSQIALIAWNGLGADFELRLTTGGWSSQDVSVSLSFNTTYYITITRSGSTIDVEIDTRNYGGTNVDTLTLEDATAERYLFLMGENAE